MPHPLLESILSLVAEGIKFKQACIERDIIRRFSEYEDFSSNAVNSTRNMFEFLGLSQANGSLHEDVLTFLDSHTKKNKGGKISNSRNIKETPFNWTNMLKPSQIQEVQSACKEAMHLWGYKEMGIQEHGIQKPMQNKDFNPVGKFVWA